MKFYKITNEKENHKGMQYKTGLNVDILPFNPHGSCSKGGIYFSREDILAFLDYGSWIREVSIPKEDNTVYEDPSPCPKKWKAYRVILGKRRKITLKVIKELHKEGADIHVGNDLPLQWASENGHLEVVKYLVSKGANIHTCDDYSLRWSSEYGHLEVVKYLVENGAKIHVGNDLPLRWASENGHLEVVKFLISQGADSSKVEEGYCKKRVWEYLQKAKKKAHAI